MLCTCVFYKMGCAGYRTRIYIKGCCIPHIASYAEVYAYDHGLTLRGIHATTFEEWRRDMDIIDIPCRCTEEG